MGCSSWRGRLVYIFVMMVSMLFWFGVTISVKGMVDECNESSSSDSGPVFAYCCIVWNGWYIDF